MNKANNNAFSEVIESSLNTFLAQCWQWDRFPTFGQLVTVRSENKIIFGIVHQIETGSMDPVRYPFPYKMTEEELLEKQPQIFEFLKTTVSCLAVGYHEFGKIFYLTPPKPPKIHAFVSHADRDMSKQFFSQFQYLHLLFGNAHAIQNLDELLLAILKHYVHLGIMQGNTIQTFSEFFSLLSGNDYRRLKLFLQRAERFV